MPSTGRRRRSPWRRADSPGEVELHDGFTNFGGTIPQDEPTHLERSRDLSADVTAFGDVTGDQRDEAFVTVMCTNGGGTAGGQTAYAIEVYTPTTDGLALLSVLRPTQPDLPVHIPYIDDSTIKASGSRVRATEVWYTDGDGTCCPSAGRGRRLGLPGRQDFEHEHSTEPRTE